MAEEVIIRNSAGVGVGSRPDRPDVIKSRKMIEVPAPTPADPKATKLVYEDTGKTDSEEKAEAAAKAAATAAATPAKDPDEPVDPGPSAGLAERAAYNKAKRAWEAKKSMGSGAAPKSPYP